MPRPFAGSFALPRSKWSQSGARTPVSVVGPGYLANPSRIGTPLPRKKPGRLRATRYKSDRKLKVKSLNRSLVKREPVKAEAS